MQNMKGLLLVSDFKNMTLNLKVPKLACSACIDRVTKAVMSLRVSATVEADTKTKMVNVQTKYSQAEIKEILVSVGYPPDNL